jgi:tetratricopeptide (TPR) repeat protein
VSELLGIFPRTADLGPFLDLLITSSTADPGRRWTASGELGTVGDRLVDAAEVTHATPHLGEEQAQRLASLYRRAAAVVEGVARGDWEGVASTLLEQGAAEEERGGSKDAELWYLAGLAVARDHGSLTAARALRLAARAARRNGDLASAAARYEEAWKGAGAMGREDDRVIAAMGRGNVEVDRGAWAEARLWYERALQPIGTEGAPRRERWQAYQNLAIVARRSGDLAGARGYLERAREEGERLADTDAAVEVENGWGQLLLAEGDPRGAEHHFSAALAAARTPVARVTIGVNLGEALLAQGRSLEAGERARDAEAAALAAGVTAKLPEVYRLLAQVARDRREGEAFVVLNRALDLIREKGLPAYEEAQTREALGTLRLEDGDPALGLAELVVAARIYDALGMGPATSRVNDLLRRHQGEPPDAGETGGTR